MSGLLEVERLHWLTEGRGRLRIDLISPPEFEDLRGQTSRAILTRASGRFVGRVDAKGPMTDLVGTYWGCLYLMSERLVSFLTKNGVSGWRAVPVDIENAPALPPLWLLVITGKTGPVYGVGEARREGLPALGFFLDPTEWDGSDLFVPANTSEILVAPACAAMLRKARLRNMRLEAVGLESTSGPWA